MRYLSIKNYAKHQHYKDRRPPWIKLHVSLLDDYDFILLPDEMKGHLMLLWALASQMDNKIPHDVRWITQRIGARTDVDVDGLMERGFLEPWDERTAQGKLENWPSRYVSAQTRADLLRSAQNRCAACNADKNLEVDHKIPISQGGTGDPSNLQILCRQCNRRKRARLANAAEGKAEHVRSDVLRSPVQSTLLETETETEAEKKLLSPVNGTRKRTPNGAPPPASTGWPVEGAELWSNTVGPIDAPRFGRAVKKVVDRYGWPETKAALECYIELKEGSLRKAEYFAGEAVTWIRLGKMPLVDPNSGALTERGQMAHKIIQRLL